METRRQFDDVLLTAATADLFDQVENTSSDISSDTHAGPVGELLSHPRLDLDGIGKEEDQLSNAMTDYPSDAD